MAPPRDDHRLGPEARAILEKNKDHRSNLYDDAWMPNMLRITWNGIALHGGPLPGYAASHGCVRMPYDFAEKLFDKTRIGMRVIISPNDAAPVEFSHPALLVPKAEALAAAPARAETLARAALTVASPWGDLPAASGVLPDTGPRAGADAVYFPSCVTRVLGGGSGFFPCASDSSSNHPSVWHDRLHTGPA